MSRSCSSTPIPARFWSERSANSAANGAIRPKSRSAAAISSRKIPGRRSAAQSPPGSGGVGTSQRSPHPPATRVPPSLARGGGGGGALARSGKGGHDAVQGAELLLGALG